MIHNLMKESLAKIYKTDLEDTIVNFINNEATKNEDQF